MIGLAALAAIVFAPPTDRPLRFRTQQTLSHRPAPLDFSMVEAVRFTRVRTGWRMSVTTISSGTDASARSAAAFDLMMAAFNGVTTTYILSAAGRPIDVVDPDRVWARSLAALDRMLAVRVRSLTPAERVPLKTFRDGYAATPPAARRAALLDNAAALLAPARLPQAGTPIAFSDVASDAGGGPVTVAGTVRRVASPPDRVAFRIDAASGRGLSSADRIRETRGFTISTRDGLLVASDRRIIGSDGTLLVDETVTRLP